MAVDGKAHKIFKGKCVAECLDHEASMNSLGQTRAKPTAVLFSGHQEAVPILGLRVLRLQLAGSPSARTIGASTHTHHLFAVFSLRCVCFIAQMRCI